MDFIYNKIFLKHKTASHPECAERLHYFEKSVKETNIGNGEKYLSLVYDKEYVSLIKRASKNSQWLDSDTYTNKDSYDCACYAVGASIKAAEENGFAVVRPPGHHATKDRAMGFCLFNNIAVAAQHMAKKGKKVFIIDFDNHHGNGTQEIFYEDSNVLYLSLHAYPAYPGTGWVDEVGKGEGESFNINVPLPPGTADDLFLEALNCFIPMVKGQFKPDVVAVSAGFDGHYGDPLTSLNLTTTSFYEAGKLLSKNFTNMFACLEGGYNPSSLHKSALSFLNGVNKKENKFMEEPTKTSAPIKKEFKERFERLKQRLRHYWPM
jgi:acetoin utilization deacetylase AcuC-like enzyme